jgi:hypothetical protein
VCHSTKKINQHHAPSKLGNYHGMRLTQIMEALCEAWAGAVREGKAFWRI